MIKHFVKIFNKKRFLSKVNFLSKNFPVLPPLSLADKFSQKIQKFKSYLLIVASGWVGLKCQGIIQEFNLGSVLRWASPCDAKVTAVFFFCLGGGGVGGWGGTVRPHYKLPLPLFCYISLLDSLNMKHFFRWQFILIFLYLTSAWMFFFCTLANDFHTSYHIKSVCSFWASKPSKQ